jgi:hypothetical protein
MRIIAAAEAVSGVIVFVTVVRFVECGQPGQASIMVW